MSTRVCVFVDGENFRFSIKDLFEEFNPNDYLPQKARWAELFDHFVHNAVYGGLGKRIRTYWYVVQYLDFYPYKFPNPQKEPDRLKALLERDDKLRRVLQKLNQKDQIKKMEETVKLFIWSQEKMRGRFEGWKRIQEGIALKHNAVEFRYAGGITYNLFNRTLGIEKAVDVKLATDLIMLRDIYDVALIVSGDQDYVPAVQAIKDFGKTVINVVFRTRGGMLLPGGARRLNQHTDRTLEVRYDNLIQYLNVGS